MSACVGKMEKNKDKWNLNDKTILHYTGEQTDSCDPTPSCYPVTPLNSVTYLLKYPTITAYYMSYLISKVCLDNSRSKDIPSECRFVCVCFFLGRGGSVALTIDTMHGNEANWIRLSSKSIWSAV